MRYIKFLLSALSLSVSLFGYAEEVATDTVKAEPKGKAIIQGFANFHTGFGADNDDRGFELDRSYLGYEYSFTNGLSVKGVMDIGQSDEVNDYHRIAYIKNAQVAWRKDGLTLSGGLISTTQFKYQESFWGYRYIMKSFQDEYKYGSSADLGVSVDYKFNDWISADVIIVNGEGYKKVQINDGLAYGLGVTLRPVEGLSFRLYGGLNEGGEAGRKDIVNLSAFAGYRTDRFRVGAEYNMIYNSGYVQNADMSGYSIYAATRLSKVVDLYARFDDSYSRHDWNIAEDESAAIVGAEFRVCKYVKIAPNFRIGMPKADGVKDNYAAYINCYFGL